MCGSFVHFVCMIFTSVFFCGLLLPYAQASASGLLLCAGHSVMPHAHGYRARTRHMFSLGFRKGGVINLSTYLRPVKVGDLVDVVANPAIHKGMPYKYYHGRTGTVFNVTPHAVGVEVNKAVRNRVVRKRLHVRIEHIRQSKCRKDFLDRVLRNDAIKRDAKAAGSACFCDVVMVLPGV
jgi:large subunit ribosomal protein L21e